MWGVEPVALDSAACETDGNPERCEESKERVADHVAGRARRPEAGTESAGRTVRPSAPIQTQVSKQKSAPGRDGERRKKPGEERHKRPARLDQAKALVEQTG